MADLSRDAFDSIRSIVRANAGIQLTEQKRALVVSRLSRRLVELGCSTFDAYVEHLVERDPQGLELRTMLNCLTTNKTDFFREPHHFDFLREQVIAAARERVASGGARRLRIWSAGCSTGEEPWTIAMVVADVLRGHGNWDVRILASDLDTNCLATAQKGIYSEERACEVPIELREDAFDRTRDGFEIRPYLRELVTFRRINFMDDPWPIRTKFDAVFCRNVTIYFDRETQDVFYHRLVKYIEPHGHFFAGHSENLSWLSDVLTPVGNTVYVPAGRKASGVVRTARPLPAAAPRAPAPPPPPPRAPETSKRSVQTGGVVASNEPGRLRTVLGTCVTACIWDDAARIGGMNHFMLPEGDDPSLPARYGIHAMELLVNELMRRGADRRRLRAKAFGAARVLGNKFGGDVASRNEAFVRSFLELEMIPLVASRFGGTSAMEVEFEPTTGRAFVRQADDSAQVVTAEERYRSALAAEQQRNAVDVELF